tara:strand:- start:2554 stop:3045 length:492 start_codon:yes stop_codon:yes gene_type:complete
MAFPWTALAILGTGLYQGHKTTQAAKRAAASARERTAQAKAAAAQNLRQMQADAAQNARQFDLQIQQAKEQTQASVTASEQARAQAQQQMAQQQQQSALMIHQQQLQSAIAMQQGASNVGQKKRSAKRGTPEAMRTKLSLDSGLGQGGTGGAGESIATGALNV